MHILPPAIEIKENEGFNPQKDIFGRKAFGEDLKRLFENVEDPLVAILDAPWGSGKTVFAKMWCGMMRNEGFPIIYFDAFAKDYMDDAFLCLASEIIEVSNKDKAFTDSAKEKFVECSKKVGKALLKTGVKAGIKALTFNLVDKDDLEALKSAASDLSKEAEAELEKYIDRKFDDYGKEKQFFESFRDALEKLVEEREKEELTPQTAGDVPDAIPLKRPLIIVIDELDRCRPPFALELLEKIKHFFTVTGVHFLLVTHLEQLTNTVKHSYGIDSFANEYLQKFYHVSIALPENIDGHSSDCVKYIKYIIKSNGLPGDHSNKGDMIDLVKYISTSKQLSLRNIEQIMTRIVLVLASVEKGYLLVSEIIAGLCVIKVMNNSLYRRVKRGDNVLDEILSFLEYDRYKEFDVDVNWWVYCYSAEIAEWMKKRSEGLWRYNIERDRIIHFMCENIDRVSV